MASASNIYSTIENSPEKKSILDINSQSPCIQHGNLVYDGKRYSWEGNMKELKHLFAVDLNLSGKWTSPGGETKLFTSKEFSVKWYGPSKGKLVLLKDNAECYLEKNLKERACKYQENVELEDNNCIGSEAGDDMELDAVVETKLIDYTLDESTLQSLEVNENNGSVLVTGDETKTCQTNQSKCKCLEFGMQIKSIQKDLSIIQMKMAGKEYVLDSADRNTMLNHDQLKEENNRLKLEHEEAKSYIKELQDSIKNLQDEKASLLTSMRIINEDYSKVLAQQPDVNLQNTNSQSQQPWQTVKGSNGQNCSTKSKAEECMHDLPTNNRYQPLIQSTPTTSMARRSTRVSDENELPIRNVNSNGKGDKKSPQKRPEQSSTKSTIILGDSILKGLRQDILTKSTHSRVNVKCFPGATLEDMKDYIRPSLLKKPGHVIIHAGTNDLSTKEPNQIINLTKNLHKTIQEISPSTRVTISSLVARSDDYAEKVIEVNSLLDHYCSKSKLGLLSHNQIDKRGLNRSGIHLNKFGTTLLAKDFISLIKRF